MHVSTGKFQSRLTMVLLWHEKWKSQKNEVNCSEAFWNLCLMQLQGTKVLWIGDRCLDKTFSDIVSRLFSVDTSPDCVDASVWRSVQIYSRRLNFHPHVECSCSLNRKTHMTATQLSVKLGCGIFIHMYDSKLTSASCFEWNKLSKSSRIHVRLLKRRKMKFCSRVQNDFKIYVVHIYGLRYERVMVSREQSVWIVTLDALLEHGPVVPLLWWLSLKLCYMTFIEWVPQRPDSQWMQCLSKYHSTCQQLPENIRKSFVLHPYLSQLPQSNLSWLILMRNSWWCSISSTTKIFSIICKISPARHLNRTKPNLVVWVASHSFSWSVSMQIIQCGYMWKLVWFFRMVCNFESL